MATTTSTTRSAPKYQPVGTAFEEEDGIRPSSSALFGRKASSGKSTKAKLWEIVFLTSFNFPYGFICGNMGLFVLPAEALRLYPTTQSVTLGLSLLIVGVSQLICPIAGRVSDSWISSTVFGKRKPFLLGGAVVGALCTFGMWLFSLCSWGILYYFCLFTAMLALNVIYSVQCGLVPDFVDEDSQGQTSGIVAVHSVAGSGLGFALMIVTTSWDYHYVYPLYIVMIVITTILSFSVALKLQSRMGGVNQIQTPGPRVPERHSSGQNFGGSIELVESRQSVIGGFRSSFSDDIGSSDSPSGVSGDSSILDITEIPSNSFVPTTSVSPHFSSPTLSSAAGGAGAIVGTRVRKHSTGSLSLANTPKVNSMAERRRMSPPPGRFRSSLSFSAGETARVGIRKYTDLTWKDILSAFTIDTSESLDFFWVFMGRTFYYVGVSVQTFVLFFLRDVVGTRDEAQRQLQIGCIALVAQGTAASIAYPIGKLSDSPRVGKKPLIYVACCCMSLVYVGFLLAPLFGSWAFAWVLTTCILYGAGNGCFLSVDYALALATLPDRKQAAQALGIWGVSAFIGSAVGPLLWGTLIQFFGGSKEGGSLGGLLGAGGGAADGSNEGGEEVTYAYTGYEAMLVGGICATLLAALMIRFVQKTNGTAESRALERETQTPLPAGTETTVFGVSSSGIDEL